MSKDGLSGQMHCHDEFGGSQIFTRDTHTHTHTHTHTQGSTLTLSNANVNVTLNYALK